MPKKLHKELVRSAAKAGLKGAQRDAYVYGTLAKIEKKKGKK